MDRPNPLDYNPSCLHVCKGVEVRITADGACQIDIQKTENDTVFPCRMYGPEDTDTWPRGDQGELMGCTKRDVRTCFDLDNAPYSNMVLGEVVNLPGKWSSYPPHHHPQPEVYFYRFDHPSGFGAGWGDGELYETHHNGLALITKGMHPQATAPGYTCCYAWGNPAPARQPVGQDPHRRHCAPLADRTGCQRAHLALSHRELTPPPFPTRRKTGVLF